MNKTKERPGVMVYFHLMEPLAALSDGDFGDMIRALMAYAQYGVIPEFTDPGKQIAWGYLRHAADVDQERYDRRCAQAREASQKRWSKDADECQRYPNTETISQADKKADADAQTQASASADKQTEPVSDPKTAAGPTHPTPGPSQNMSPAWGKMMNALYRLEQDKAKAAKQVEDQQLLDAVRKKRQEIGLPA